MSDFETLLLRTMLQSMPSATLVEDSSRRILHVNPQFCAMFSVPAEPGTMVGQDCSNAAEETKHLFQNSEEFVSRLEVILLDREQVLGDLLTTKDGRYLERDYLPLWLDDSYQGHMWVYRDVTERETQRIRDPLTGLHNRRGFMELANQRHLQARRAGESVQVIVVDMDGLKPINDTHGHAAGDRAICDLAVILRHTLREADIVGRLGGDEFAIVLAEPSEMGAVLSRVADAVEDFNETRQRPFVLSVSVGVADSPTQTLEQLLHDADEAMYGHKNARLKSRES